MAAGHLALELVNTVSWRHDPARCIERLDGPEAVAAFARRHGLPVATDTTARDAAALRELRETIHGAVLARIAGNTATRAANGVADGAPLHRLREAAVGAVARAGLDLEATAGPWVADPSTARGLRDHFALAAVDLLATADPARLRACADDDCGWLFHDRSRSGTRRWCDAADCGNRARVRRHRQGSTA